LDCARLEFLIVASFRSYGDVAMLLLDRYCDFHFFTNDLGGNPMMYVNLIWSWGHRRCTLDTAGVRGVPEVSRTFSGKHCSARSMVMATMAICVLSFLVCCIIFHHGRRRRRQRFFGVMTMLIAVPRV